MTTFPIKLAEGYTPMVSEGEQVIPGDRLAMRMVTSNITLTVSQMLGVPIRGVGKALRKSPGDRIVPGDVVARKRRLLGSEEIISEVYGTILRFERENGTLIIKLDKPPELTPKEDTTHERTDEGTVEYIISPLDGTIAMCNNGEIQITTEKNVLVGENGCGDSAEGTLYYVKARDEKTHQIDPTDVTTDAIGKIIIGVHFTREVLMKAVGIGVLGIIGLEISDEDITYLIGKDVKEPVIQVSKEDLTTLLKRVGKRVFLEGKTKAMLMLNYENRNN